VTPRAARAPDGPAVVAHLTTVDMSLRYLLLPQLRAVVERGGVAVGISAPGPWVPELEAAGVRFRPLASSTRSFSLVADLRAAYELWKVLRAERPLVLHTHNPKPGLYGRIVGRLARVPIVVNTVHGLYATEDDPLPTRAVVYTLEAIAARCSDAELVQNPEDLARLHRLRISPRAGLLGNGVDLVRFDPDRLDPSVRTARRAEWGVRDDQVVIGSIGRLVREKGFPELVDAVGRLDPDRFVLVWVGGSDPAKPDAVTEADLAAARARGVRLLGHRDDVPEILAGCDAFALASHREGYPRAAMEAAAMGLPIVATDVRGCREVAVPGVNGLRVPVGDAAALARALDRLADPERRRAWGDASRARAVTHFDERAVVARVLDTYAAVARRKRLAWTLTGPPPHPGARPAPEPR
jgi:glycosyltransferase involved in cell wall biosynthesis